MLLAKRYLGFLLAIGSVLVPLLISLLPGNLFGSSHWTPVLLTQRLRSVALVVRQSSVVSSSFRRYRDHHWAHHPLLRQRRAHDAMRRHPVHRRHMSILFQNAIISLPIS